MGFNLGTYVLKNVPSASSYSYIKLQVKPHLLTYTGELQMQGQEQHLTATRMIIFMVMSQ